MLLLSNASLIFCVSALQVGISSTLVINTPRDMLLAKMLYSLLHIKSWGIRMKYSKLDGMNVVTLDGFQAGEISGMELNTKKWEATHLHIELSDEAVKELGYKKPLLGHITICLPVGYIKAVGNVVTLTRNLKGLDKIPECK